jgi:alpha 1,2-mannosyltransferase
LLGSVTALRELGCTLPVEIWSFPDELVGIPVHVKTNLLALGNITFRASTTQRTQSSKQYQIKGEAIAHTQFTEILYLDSDNVPVRDPTFLFDAPLYKTHGIVLWPDFVRESPANPVFRLLGFDCDPEEFTAESGQVLVNREGQGGMNQAALLAAETMQRDSAFWFRLSMGDKDTFRYAWKLFGLPYTAAPHLFSAVGAVTKTYTSRDGRAHTL